MARKVILDVDPGIDDAVALVMALFDPRLEVVGVTAVEGNVDATQSSRNVQAVIEQLDPPRWPRIGSAWHPENHPHVDNKQLFGPDGLGNADFEVAELQHQHPSYRLMVDLVRQSPGEITIVALGPLTNIARAMQYDPDFCAQIGQLVIKAGSIAVGGNVTAAAEFNVFYDTLSAARVFESPSTKTLVPLDVTHQVMLGFNVLDQLPGETTRAGRLLHKILPYTFRAHRQVLGMEGIHLDDAVAMTMVTNPELFQSQRMSLVVESSGEHTMGSTVFDRRPGSPSRFNVDVCTEIEAGAVADCILRALKEAGDRSAIDL